MAVGPEEILIAAIHFRISDFLICYQNSEDENKPNYYTWGMYGCENWPITLKGEHTYC